MDQTPLLGHLILRLRTWCTLKLKYPLYLSCRNPRHHLCVSLGLHLESRQTHVTQILRKMDFFSVTKEGSVRMATYVQQILNNNFAHLDDQQITEAFDSVLDNMEAYISRLEAIQLPAPTTPLSRQTQVYGYQSQYYSERAERGWAEYYEALEEAINYNSSSDDETDSDDGSDDGSVVVLKEDESPEFDDREGCAYCSGCMFCMRSDNYDGDDEI